MFTCFQFPFIKECPSGSPLLTKCLRVTPWTKTGSLNGLLSWPYVTTAHRKIPDFGQFLSSDPPTTIEVDAMPIMMRLVSTLRFNYLGVLINNLFGSYFLIWKCYCWWKLSCTTVTCETIWKIWDIFSYQLVQDFFHPQYKKRPLLKICAKIAFSIEDKSMVSSGSPNTVGGRWYIIT